MGLLDQIGSYVGSHDKGRQLKISELRPIEAGKTVPPVSPRAKVVHLRNFETIADDLESVRDKIERAQRERIELEQTIEKAREVIEQEMRDLRLKENTLKDELTQHIEAILPDAELVHKVPKPPHPDELDVTVQTPPAIPEKEQ
jgi:septal ring factor EnvC (AmiA/AmiB activator)